MRAVATPSSSSARRCRRWPCAIATHHRIPGRPPPHEIARSTAPLEKRGTLANRSTTSGQESEHKSVSASGDVRIPQRAGDGMIHAGNAQSSGMIRSNGPALFLAGIATVACTPSRDDASAITPEFFNSTDIRKISPAPDPPSVTMPSEGRPVEPEVVVVQRQAPYLPEPYAVVVSDRESLTRQLQSELKRVGCYEGKLDGVWTLSTHRAMNGFLDGVNARLPTNQPDIILLALVRNSQEMVCREPCLGVQGASRKKCSSTLAQIGRAAQHGENAIPAITGWVTTPQRTSTEVSSTDS